MKARGAKSRSPCGGRGDVILDATERPGSFYHPTIEDGLGQGGAPAIPFDVPLMSSPEWSYSYRIGEAPMDMGAMLASAKPEAEVRESWTPEALILWGDHNPGLGPDYGEYCADIIGARFYELSCDRARFARWAGASRSADGYGTLPKSKPCRGWLYDGDCRQE